jgi:methylenetetrahydrofolate reductase (NADPH)
MTESRLAQTLAAGHFAVTAEITPPLSTSAAKVLAEAEPLKGLVDGINTTDSASARVAMSSFTAAAILAQNGFDPIVQMTCRDRNRIALQSDLLGFNQFGIRNVLVLTGDDPKVGDQPETKPVFDLKSNDLITTIVGIRDKHKLPSVRDVDGDLDMFIGAADMPIDPPADWKPASLMSKIAVGAQFAQTQFCMDIDIAKRYFKVLADHGITEKLKILLGVVPPASGKSARWIKENLFGAIIPDAMIERIEGAADQRAEGRKACAEFIQQLAAEVPNVAGVHIMAPMNVRSIPEVIELSGVRKGRK